MRADLTVQLQHAPTRHVTQGKLHRSRRTCVCAQVVQYGGRLDEALEEDTTHLVLCRGVSAEADAPLTPGRLLQALLRARKGGAAGLRALRAGLLARSLHIVDMWCARWPACRLCLSASKSTTSPCLLQRDLVFCLIGVAGLHGEAGMLAPCSAVDCCRGRGMLDEPIGCCGSADWVLWVSFLWEVVCTQGCMVLHSWVDGCVDLLEEGADGGSEGRSWIARPPEQLHAALPPPERREGEDDAAAAARRCIAYPHLAHQFR